MSIQALFSRIPIISYHLVHERTLHGIEARPLLIRKLWAGEHFRLSARHWSQLLVWWCLVSIGPAGRDASGPVGLGCLIGDMRAGGRRV